MGELIDGKQLAQTVKASLTTKVAALKRVGITPCLVVVLVGEDPASQVYVRNKHRQAEKIGMASRVIRLPETTTQAELLALIDQLNNDASVDGILVQLPLPRHIDEQAVTDAIIPQKDADGFHPINMGQLFMNHPNSVPCTPAGIMEMFAAYNVDLAGKHAVIVGRSNIVGRPLAALLLNADATVTIAHSKTKDLAALTRQADILVVAVGRPKLLDASYVKPGAVVIDVGINRQGKHLVGDVDFESVKDVASLITPVPGGVGPMTIAMLLAQTVTLAQKRLINPRR